MIKCSVCGAMNPVDATFCENCGSDLSKRNQDNNKICPQCSTVNSADTLFCTNCGYSFSQLNSQQDKVTNTELSRSDTSKRPRKKWPWIFVVILLTLLVASGGYFVYSHQQDTTRPLAESAISSKSTETSEEASIKAENSSLRAEQTSQSSNQETTNFKKVALSDQQKQMIMNGLSEWADNKASTDNKAVSGFYYSHGTGGLGDWYAKTPGGDIQVQNNNVPGVSGFKVHAIGGLMFYTAKDGTTGEDTSLNDGTGPIGYATNVDFDKTVTKYLFGDNGVVYELKLGNGETVTPLDGFGQLNDNGKHGSSAPKKSFKVSRDSDAKAELQKLIEQNS